MIKLKIDPEFKAKIPAMTDEQFNGLREDILRDGYVRDPLVVWQEETTLLDGHHRWTIICENWELLKDKYSIDYKSFPDRWAALEWICRNQLNKHNLNDEQITYIRGEMYKARKKSNGGNRGNQYKKLPVDQNDPLAEKPKSTAEAIARELGVAEPTVKRSEKFHDGIDALRKVSPEAADKVMKGGSGVKKQDVMSVPKMDLEDQKQFADDIVSGAVKTKQKNHHSQTKAEREALKATEAIILANQIIKWMADIYGKCYGQFKQIDMVNACKKITPAKIIAKGRSNTRDCTNSYALEIVRQYNTRRRYRIDERIF